MLLSIQIKRLTQESKLRVTIKDIAKKLNISTAAVSKALNNLSGVSEDLRERVKEAAKEMGYTPNLIAKNLVQKRTNKIALFIISFLINYF